MSDVSIGRAIRAVRIRRGWRQVDVAVAAGVSQDLVSRLERGLLDGVTVRRLRAVISALDMELALIPRWRGAELDRLLGARHSVLHEEVGAWLAGIGGWQTAPEVTFAIYGERGVIDILAWHAASRSLLVIELKTEIGDVQELVGTMDRKLRLARQVARERGWDAATVSGWVIVAASRTNRRRVAAHATMLRSAYPADGRQMSAWIREPRGAIVALSAWERRSPYRRIAPTRRIRQSAA